MSDDLKTAQALVHREARLLDLARWDEWLDLFTEDCEYWVPLSPEQDDPKREVSLFYEDRLLMETRIRRLRHPAAHSVVAAPIRTSHVISGTTVEPNGGDALTARSSFLMLEQHGERQRMFGGLLTHDLRRAEGDLRIRAKRVDLTNCDAAHEVIEVFL